ncbi:MAG: tRNA (N(6)-L-threonylcarbamoyladenosine(37)-C(2))-methylthiotransferase MtaB [Lentisphaerae bacterium GWF2_44_16]|nr:MAG: tRNA (N(6)-L-threonylcarbamoyladenosine(37)-C(2))-methylthiotransferase MtaB [Lentisphaerae bacterium GWF2_44_16]
MSQKHKKIMIMTIGCRLNQADTALMLDRFRNAAYEILHEKSKDMPDIFILNTCSVTASASRKGRQAIRAVRRKNPDICIIVTGCDADVRKDFWKDEGTPDIVLSNEGKKKIIEHVEAYYHGKDKDIPDNSRMEIFRENASALFPFRSRAFLKVQEGCNSFCSYCIVPYARGRERSRDFGEVLEDFRNMLEKGHKEIILTGVNISAYNHDGKNLASLLETLSSMPGDFRIRLSSTEPHPENYNIIDIMADNPKICRFLHIPLQHGTTEILKSMNRKYTPDEFARFISYARSKVKGIHLGTDVIVGFPGETQELFMGMCEFAKKVNFANMHIFPFSIRPGTPAAAFPGKVPEREARLRFEYLNAIASAMASDFALSQKNETLKVLIEEESSPGVFEGWSDNYLRVRIKGADLCRNDFAEVLITDVGDDGLLLGKL